MRSKTKIIISSIILLIVASIIGVTIYSNLDESDVELAGFNNISEFYPSNRHTYSEDLKPAVSLAPEVLGETVREISTEIGKVEVDEKTLAFKFTNKRGYTWASTVDYNSENAELNTKNKNRVRSALIVSVYDTTSASYNIREYYMSDATSVTLTEVENGFQNQ